MNRTLIQLLLFSCLFTACTFTQKIRDGKTAFERKQFSTAIPMLKKEYNKSKSKVEKGKIAFMLGESYRRSNQSEASIDWYYNAYEYSYGVDALKEYAYGLKRSERYEEAQDAFKNLGIEIGSPYEYRREITACKQAADWKSRKTENGFTVSSMAFNSSGAEYAPSLYADRYVLITSDRSEATGEASYNWTGNAFSDLFLVDLTSNSVAAFDPMINTENNEGTAITNPAQTEIIFTRCYSDDKYGDNFCKLMTSIKTGEEWSTPEVLSFTDDGVNYGHPALSEDGNTLYFSSNHPDGWGGYDLYSSERLDDGWDEPQLLSRTINTIGDEKFPTIDQDTLYFSSNFHTGMGGLDIFKTYRNNKGEWTPIQNLLPPVNSGADDFGYLVDYRTPNQDDIIQKGYFSSSRNGGSGNDDIYAFERRPPPPPPPLPDTVEPEPIVYEMILNVYVLEKIYEDPADPNSKVLGRKPLNNAALEMTLNGKKSKFQTKGNDPVEIQLEKDQDYYFFATEEGYLNNDARFSSKGVSNDDPRNPKKVFEVEIVLDKIFTDKEIVLENIYYDFNKDFIREDAKPTLNALVKTLKQNPQVNIQLSSHTDCRGDNAYNEDLSQRRAQSAVNYLINEGGISADRLLAKGYGESQPAADCNCNRCTEEEHQTNRRTTFKILE